MVRGYLLPDGGGIGMLGVPARSAVLIFRLLPSRTSVSLWFKFSPPARAFDLVLIFLISFRTPE
jgi:hypothetical protein